MTYQKHSNISYKRGFLLTDAFIAISLATLFVIAYADTSEYSRQIYIRAQSKNDLLDVYSDHANEFADLMPYESRSSTYVSPRGMTTVVSAIARWYGNDRIETDIHLSDGDTSVDFVAMRAYPFLQPEDAAGKSLCNVDFSRQSQFGSFNFFHNTPSATEDFAGRIVITPIILPIPAIPLTDLEIRDDIAYISTDSSKQADPDILIVDMTDVNNPRLLSGLNTGPGIVAISIAGTNIYAAASSRVGQLQIIHLSDLEHPQIISNYRLPLPEASTTPPIASSIFYKKGRVYLGTEKWPGDEFSLIDVSDPALPAYVSGVDIDSKINDIFVVDTTAYVAASDQYQLRRIDLADEHTLQTIDAFDPSGWQRQEGKTLAYFENSLVFGRTTGGFNISNDHEFFDWNPATNSLVNFSSSTDVSGGIYGIVRDRFHTFTATHRTGSELLIFDRIASSSSPISISLPAPIQSLTCDGAYLYALGIGSSIIYKISFN